MGDSSTILVVDDEGSIRRFIVYSLSHAGYRVLGAGDAGGARKLMCSREDTVALLISDIRMPGTSGLDLALDLESRMPGLKVLYISGLTDSIAVQSLLLKSPLAILTKPFTAGQLLARVQMLLSNQVAKKAPRTELGRVPLSHRRAS